MAKGKSGSFRANSLTASDLSAMEAHELRLDHAGTLRSIRKDTDGGPVPPLIYNPLRQNSLTQAHAAHVAGAKVNAGAGKVCRHAFVQFPTDLEITPETEQMMLDQATAFVNQTHGGNAVFWARLDRDEAGRHGVDVFFAPKYEKATKRGSTTWISLTKFGKERAVDRFGQRQDQRKNPKTGDFEPVTDKNGDPVMVDCDSQHFQGRAFQDLWAEHLRDTCGLDWVERGTRKVGRDPDRLEVEEYKLAQDRKAAEAEAEQILATAEKEGRARIRIAQNMASKSLDVSAEAHRIAQEARRATERAQEAKRAAEMAQGASEARTEALRAEIAVLEAQKADIGSFLREARAEIALETQKARKAMEAEWNDQLEDIGRIRREAEGEVPFLRKALERSERLHRIVLDCIIRVLPPTLAETLRKAIRVERDKDQPSRGPSAPGL